MKKSIISFVSVIVLIAVLGFFAIKGLYIPTSFDTGSSSSSIDETEYKTIIPSVFDSENGIKKGLDLVGGSSITYEAQLPEGYDNNRLTSDMNSAVEILRYRLTSQGYTEAQVSKQGEKRITVEIPQIKNPEEAVQVLGQTAQLTFNDMEGKEWLTGSDIKSASYQYGSSQTGLPGYYVALNFTKDGAKKFSEATKTIAERKDDGTNIMYIMLDGQIISFPMVDQQITDDSCIIQGSFTEQEASQLANLIGSGALPFSLNQVELRAVGPQLGADALSSSIKAAAIGIVLVAIFMIVVYRLPGVISVIALCFYIVIETLILSIFKVNLSLPGIAGIILSIGMAVDANVVIFERIKEEVKAGKTAKMAIDSGFKRAFTAILDSNITTLIASGVLFFFGSGTIVGFATTLGIGVLISMFTALTVTHFLLNCMVDFKIRNPKAYGA